MAQDTLGEFEQSLLLAIVHLEGGAYGVAIRHEVDRRLQREVAIGALYTSLDRLEKKGYLRSSMSDSTPERGGRSKRYFRLTPLGATVLRNARARMDRMWRGLSADLKKARP